jgi:hypothetical protein
MALQPEMCPNMIETAWPERIDAALIVVGVIRTPWAALPTSPTTAAFASTPASVTGAD